MPHPSPFTQADIEARSRLTGLPKFARPAAKGDVQPEDVLTPTEIASIEAEVQKEIFEELTEVPGITPTMLNVARNWDFSAAIDTLGLRDIDGIARCKNELILICINHKLAKRAEAEETPGRKARAFQLAPQKKRRQRPFLPQSLQQEAVRALGRIPCSCDDYALLQKKMMRMARRGRYKSWALRNTIHALQACAAAWNEKLIWDENGRSPPKPLLKFLVQVLRAAKIKRPDPDENYSKFVALMLRPRKPRQTEQPTERPPKKSKAERQSVPLSTKSQL
jgi:hypothetical protein